LTVHNAYVTTSESEIGQRTNRITFNNCAWTNNGASSPGFINGGPKGFGLGATNIKFVNCSMTDGPNGYGYTIDNGVTDDNWEISGGTYSGFTNDTNDVMIIQGNGAYIHDATFIGPTSGTGIRVTGSNACINNNTFNSGLGGAISVANNTDIGSGNILNGLSGNLASGICETAGGVNPPTNLTATAN